LNKTHDKEIMMKIRTYALLILLTAGAVSCKKEDVDVFTPVDLGGETWQNTLVDQWLLDSLTIPYNIAVKYKWLPGELNHLDRNLTPPDESKIIPAMSSIKRVWIDPYNAETGDNFFIKKYAPKQFILIGSVEYNPNGTVLLGQAEGGNSIAFFDINQNFDKNSSTSIRRMIQTSHHEFAHILHQNIIFPQDFRGISNRLGLTGYTGTWFNVSEEEARENGYITAYSMASAEEDFVEMVANMLMEGESRFNEIVESVNPTAQDALRSKEQYVVNYFREVWNIDFYSLQTRVQNALNALVPTPDVSDEYGAGNIYTTASVDPSNQTLLPQRPGFMSILNSSAAAVAQIPNLGLSLDSLAIVAASADSSILRLYISQNNVTFFADYTYGLNISGEVYTYTFGSENENGEFIHAEVTPLLDYFSNNQFTLSWYVDPSITIFPRVRFSPVANANNYFLALLLP
jgi:substrate import-associated zinc metallohydrolase lipoprotein